jgi:O-antigen/teichoic acid export membrane protein
MSQLQRNIVANFVGKGWSALMGVIFIPLYIKFMGIEAYGLVGFFLTLQSIVSLMDAGLSTTLNRELAYYSAQPEQAQEMQDVVRTLETIYWGGAILIGVAVLLLAEPIAQYWIKAETLSVNTVQRAVQLMGLILVLQWPFFFYASGLLGLQRQVLHSGLDAFWYTLRYAGAVAVLWLVSPSIVAFFSWQIIVSVISTVLMATALWRCLPPSRQAPRFHGYLLRTIWRFTAGMSAVAGTFMLLTQMDKIILSKTLPLEMFGYYSLAGSIVFGLAATMISPLFTAFFPRFSQHIAAGDTEGLKQLYHRGCQLMSVIILPVAVIVALFSREILFLWTRDAMTVQHTHKIVSFLIIGTALHGLINIPYALQLAYGWTSLMLCTNIIAMVVLAPLLVVVTPYYGVLGAGAVWVALNFGYVLITLQLMHRRLLRGEGWRWYLEDTGLPLVTVWLVAGIGRWLLPTGKSVTILLLSLAGVYGCTFIAAVLAAPCIRTWLWRQRIHLRLYIESNLCPSKL